MQTLASLSRTCLVALLATVGSASAQIINVDFNMGGSTTFYDNFLPTPESPVPGTGPFWNGVSITSGNQFSPGSFTSNTTLLASDGITPTTVAFSVNFGGAYNENPFPANGNYTTALLADYAYTASGVSRTLTITGLAADTIYDIYLYAQNTGYRSNTTTFSVTGDFSSTGLPLSATATNSGTGFTFDLNNSYVRFTSSTALKSNGTGQIVIDWVGTGEEGSLNGFQLVTVPEPTTAAMVGLLIPGLLWLRKRQAS